MLSWGFRATVPLGNSFTSNVFSEERPRVVSNSLDVEVSAHGSAVASGDTPISKNCWSASLSPALVIVEPHETTRRRTPAQEVQSLSNADSSARAILLSFFCHAMAIFLGDGLVIVRSKSAGFLLSGPVVPLCWCAWLG